MILIYLCESKIINSDFLFINRDCMLVSEESVPFLFHYTVFREVSAIVIQRTCLVRNGRDCHSVVPLLGEWDFLIFAHNSNYISLLHDTGGTKSPLVWLSFLEFGKLNWRRPLMQKFIIRLKVNTVFNVRCYLLTIVHHSFHFLQWWISFWPTISLKVDSRLVLSLSKMKDERFLACVLRFPQYFLYCILQNHRQKAPQKTVSAVK